MPVSCKFGHDVGNRLANSGELAKPVLGDNAVERLDKGRECIRSAKVDFGAEIIVARESCAAA
jgi:hypothetical protein